VARALHRVRRGALLGEVDDRIGAPVRQQRDELVEVLGDVEVVGGDLAAGQLLPRGDARGERLDRRERVGAQLDVGLAPGEVVDDADVVVVGREVQRRRPSAEAVAAQDQDPQGSLQVSVASTYAMPSSMPGRLI
jgi:hypothetical protein